MGINDGNIVALGIFIIIGITITIKQIINIWGNDAY